MTRHRHPRVVVLGFDGLDPRRLQRWIDAGHLPAFAKLQGRGGLKNMTTTTPPLSPVAWSSFATGVNPGKHGIFGFTTRSQGSPSPTLSSVRFEAPTRQRRFKGQRVPWGVEHPRALQRSKPFWHYLGAAEIPSTILRVPISFPPKPFAGQLLSAMAAPDLLGTQGTFWLYSSALAVDIVGEYAERGQHRPLVPLARGGWQGELEGPRELWRPWKRHRISFQLQGQGEHYVLRINGQSIPLRPGRDSPWIPLRFGLIPGLRQYGLMRARLVRTSPDTELYIGPLQMDPWRPRQAISHPGSFAAQLATAIGPYATLGLAEDLWGLNSGALDEAGFIEQSLSLHRERERMLLHTLREQPDGLVVCVFDGTDRIQHLFGWELEPEHPYRPHRDVQQHIVESSAILGSYIEADITLAKVMEQLDLEDPDTWLFVLSDHGFASFTQQVDLNRWLLDEGYLCLVPGAQNSEAPFAQVDWSRTRAYAMGLVGLYLNLEGREPQGIVAQEDAYALAKEIAQGLEALRDPQGNAPLAAAWLSEDIYRGPYIEDAPEIVVAFNSGWRVSWTGPTGAIGDHLFAANEKRWSGDHAVDSRQVPGVFLSSRPLPRATADCIHITDLAPTVLAFFGIEPPRYLDGHSLL